MYLIILGEKFLPATNDDVVGLQQRYKRDLTITPMHSMFSGSDSKMKRGKPLKTYLGQKVLYVPKIVVYVSPFLFQNSYNDKYGNRIKSILVSYLFSLVYSILIKL